MLSAGTICSLLLLGVLWVDLAMAGSSFLSPEHQKAQQRKEPKKPPAKLQPRALEGWLDPEDRGQAEGAEEELEIRVSAPPLKLHPGLLYHYRPLTTPQKDVSPDSARWIRALYPQATVRSDQSEFNAPFDVGIKLSGAQYQQHGRALGKFLQDILWEEAEEAPANK